LAAATILLQDIKDKTAEVIKVVPSIVGQSERRLNALIDFGFNLGTGLLKNSHLKSAVDARDWNGAAEQLKLWCHAHVDGKLVEVPALVARRAITAGWMLEG
jgi:lysozyme